MEDIIEKSMEERFKEELKNKETRIKTLESENESISAVLDALLMGDIEI